MWHKLCNVKVIWVKNNNFELNSFYKIFENSIWTDHFASNYQSCGGKYLLWCWIIILSWHNLTNFNWNSNLFPGTSNWIFLCFFFQLHSLFKHVPDPFSIGRKSWSNKNIWFRYAVLASANRKPSNPLLWNRDFERRKHDHCRFESNLLHVFNWRYQENHETSKLVAS